MKGDFSTFPLDRDPPWSGVLHQQGRVLLDQDWNAKAQIDARWQARAAADAFGLHVLAVPQAAPAAFQVLAAQVDGDHVQLTLGPGHAWASGLLLSQATTTTLHAHYLAPPLAPATSTASIVAGTRDAVLLEVWEDTVSAFQATELLEPALGGPDTTTRTRAFASARLLRLGADDDCSAVAALSDPEPGRLTVSPAPTLVAGGDCPLEAGGGYTGLEHFLYRIEIAEPDPAAPGQARFKWSQFNGGLVGRGSYTPGALPATGTVDITANMQAIAFSGLAQFHLEALQFDAALGAWRVACTADASPAGDGQLALVNLQGAWPAAAPATAFFRLWNGIARVADFPDGAPVPLHAGIQLAFEPDTGGNYRPGDFWAFPVRAAGAAFAQPPWPTDAPPQGPALRRVALAEITWNAARAVRFEDGGIEDCRRPFRPLTNQKICCTFNVGDGRTSFGDFNRIEDAVRHLPAAGGEICLLPGLHTTNTVLRGRQHVTVRGCGVQTKVVPRDDGASRPIFLVQDCSDIQLLHMDLATLTGSAVVVEGSKPGATRDIEIAHHRMLAAGNAVRARFVAGLHVHHNRIRMLDRPGGGVGIYLAGDDSLIERNDIRLQPHRETPPIDQPDRPDPVDPTDPCATLDLVLAHPRRLVAYIDQVWAVALPLLRLAAASAAPLDRALGGIQIGGGSERVRVLENTVVGGAGNGITLGALAAPEGDGTDPPPAFSFEITDRDAKLLGTVFGPDGKPLAGVQITLTPLVAGIARPPQVSNAQGEFGFGLTAGTYRVDEGAVGLRIAGIDAQRRDNGVWTLTVKLEDEPAPAEADDGFLYTIAIERNHVGGMGLSGIGVPPSVAATPAAATATRLNTNVRAVDAARALLGCPVVGLVVRDNVLQGNLRLPFDSALRQEVLVRGVGGISLGLVDDALIAGNRIEGNGRSALDPACGIFVQYGEDVDIHHNQVLDHGSVPTGTRVALVPGQRGGIVLGLVTSFGNLATLQGGTATTGARPAARVMDNTVSQPVGCALRAAAMGPLMVNDNHFASGFAGATAFERAAGTVFVFNLAGVQEAGAGQDLKRPGSSAVGGSDVAAPAPAPVRDTASTGNLGMNQRARVQPVAVAVARPAAAQTLLPLGMTMFNHNQSQTGPANAATACHLVYSLDDVAYQDNQSVSQQATPVFANALVAGTTLRATGNRLREAHRSSLMSLFTLAVRANNTSFNQGDHCIIATDQNPGMPEIQAGNQVLFPSSLCARVNMTTALLFKPLE